MILLSKIRHRMNKFLINNAELLCKKVIKFSFKNIFSYRLNQDLLQIQMVDSFNL